MAHLLLTNGAERIRFALDRERVSIGRSPENDIVLDNEPTISRFHAVLERNGDRWLLRDLGSRNGTWLNGERVTDAMPFESADEARIGDYVLRVQLQPELGQTLDASDLRAAREVINLGLSPRELDVIRLVAQGLSDQAIGEQLFISVKTVHSHLDRIRDKIGLRRRPELMRFATEHGLA